MTGRWSAQALIDVVEAMLGRHALDHSIAWHRSGEPFHTQDGALREAVRAAIAEVTGLVPQENTAGGTSDGRFIAPLGAQVVEVGPVNASIHKVDEHVSVADLEQLPALYLALLERLLAQPLRHAAAAG